MSVLAIPAQGTTLHISGTAATPEVITAVTAGYPTILAITGHAGVANGDVIALAGFTGADAATLNSQTAVVKNYATGATNDTFAIDINTVGKTITCDGSTTVTPTAWIKVGQLKSISATGSSAAEIDVTDLDSTAKEFRTGLKDSGSITMNGFVLDSDVGQAAMLAAFSAQTSKNFKVTYPSGSTPIRTFAGSVKAFPEVGNVSTDGVVDGSIEIRVSGAVTPS